jgi:hypothetical protein
VRLQVRGQIYIQSNVQYKQNAVPTMMEASQHNQLGKMSQADPSGNGAILGIPYCILLLAKVARSSSNWLGRDK